MIVRINLEAGQYIKEQHKATEIPIGKMVSKIILAAKERAKKDPPVEGYQDFMEIYHIWFKLSFGIDPQISIADASGLKKLIRFFNKTTRDDLKRSKDMFEYILYQWDKQTAFIQGQTALRQINSNINQIISGLKIKRNEYGQIAEKDPAAKFANDEHGRHNQGSGEDNNVTVH